MDDSITKAQFKYCSKNDFVILTEKKQTNTRILVANDDLLAKGYVQSCPPNTFKEGEVVIFPKSAAMPLEEGIYAIKAEYIIATCFD